MLEGLSENIVNKAPSKLGPSLKHGETKTSKSAFTFFSIRSSNSEYDCRLLNMSSLKKKKRNECIEQKN